MLDRITFVFPFGHLQPLLRLLAQTEGAKVQDSAFDVVITPPYPAQSSPQTVLKGEDVYHPSVRFEGNEAISVRLGHLWLTSGREVSEAYPWKRTTEVDANTISAEELFKRFDGYVSRLDHAGLEIPSSMLSMQEWQTLQAAIGRMCNFYAYPEEHEWPFIIPATNAEFADEIRAFNAPRDPKFEFTYGYVDEPLLQFHIDTTLPRAAVEERLPEGFKLGGVVESFRSVFIAHPWENLKIRCDLTFNPEGVKEDWDNATWLVTEGRRIR